MTGGAGRGRVGVRCRLVAAVAVVLVACGGSEAPPPPSPAAPRSFALGFTPFPYARSLEALAFAQDVIAREGDMEVLHFDDGVPWAEAFAGAPYDPAYEADLENRARSVPPGHVVYVAVTPVAFERDRLAPHRGAQPNEPLSPDWAERAFDDPEVVEAYLSHCERMIAIFAPDYFAYAIEANLVFRLAPERWPGLLRLCTMVYTTLKARHPALHVFATLQADAFLTDPAQTPAVAPLVAASDLVAVSTYPYTEESDPARLRPDFLSGLAALAPGKRFAVAETAWPAEDVTAPYRAFIPGTEERQRQYVERLLSEADGLSAVFVNWFFTRDYDDLWEAELKDLPNASLLRLWKDTGVYAGDGRARPALASWRAVFARPRSR
jgi:hypothetical protein